MSDPVPMNELDKAIMALQRSQAAFPELCRTLCKGDLWLLVKFHPEIENQEVEWTAGMPLPFIRLKMKIGEVVPGYSSEARAREGMLKAKFPARSFCPARVAAMQVLEILGAVKLPMVINKGCATGEVTLPWELFRDLANGTALQPEKMESGNKERITMELIDPADYPTDLVQAAFDFFRKHKNFRAAWIFTRTAQPPPERKPYYIFVLMDPRDEGIYHDFNLVIGTTGNYEAGANPINEKNPKEIENMFKVAKPFYVAADYQPPK